MSSEETGGKGFFPEETGGVFPIGDLEKEVASILRGYHPDERIEGANPDDFSIDGNMGKQLDKILSSEDRKAARIRNIKVKLIKRTIDVLKDFQPYKDAAASALLPTEALENEGFYKKDEEPEFSINGTIVQVGFFRSIGQKFSGMRLTLVQGESTDSFTLSLGTSELNDSAQGVRFYKVRGSKSDNSWGSGALLPCLFIVRKLEGLRRAA